MQNYDVFNHNTQLDIEENSPYKAAEEFAEAENLCNGSHVVVEGHGTFNIATNGDYYIATNISDEDLVTGGHHHA
ncbi:hypothetical protein [Dasania marina]|uniref:hypothetical protein n=1 Tax=Dasania marina TaxID=471499 RepID=UPI000376DEAD|nr:hypothetical protein [Dasania marina]